MASQTPLAPATASVSQGVRKARIETAAAVNIPTGPACGAFQRSTARSTSSTMMGTSASAHEAILIGRPAVSMGTVQDHGTRRGAADRVRPRLPCLVWPCVRIVTHVLLLDGYLSVGAILACRRRELDELRRYPIPPSPVPGTVLGADSSFRAGAAAPLPGCGSRSGQVRFRGRACMSNHRCGRVHALSSTSASSVPPREGETMTSRRKQSADAPRPDESAERTDERKAAPRRAPRQPRPYPDLVDDTLDDSFPASDPPSWAGQ